MTKTENKPLKILNLYAGIGGNRKLWTGNIEVTAIENVPEIAKIYQDFFPNDKIIIADAHQYLLEHYKEFDFIWSSPPCQTHSRARYWSSKGGIVKPKYPDIKLYEEIIFLDNYFKGKFVVENVIPYYPPLIKTNKRGRHYIWCNFELPEIIHIKSNINKGTIKSWEKAIGLTLRNHKVNQRKDQILRNCVEPELGLHIFQMAFRNKQEVLKL